MTTVLEEANEIIYGARNESYGHPRDNFKNIADLWTAYLGWEIKPMDIPLMMILVKVARLEDLEYHRDSVVDIAGYAGTIERLQELAAAPLADWERELLANPVTTWVEDGRRYWSVWSEIPKATLVNSSDEEDDYPPWSGTGGPTVYGIGPWREFIEPRDTE